MQLSAAKRMDTTGFPQGASLARIQAAMEAAGVEFTEGEQPGVRIKVTGKGDTGGGHSSENDA